VLKSYFPTSEVFVARITRKELKTDKFALEVEHTVTLFEEHRKEIIQYGGAGLVVALVVFGILFYSGRQHAARESALAKAIAVQQTPVGAAAPGQPSFPTQEAKDQAALKAFTDLRSQYGSSTEGEIALYYLGSIQSDQGNLAEAEKSFAEVADHGDAQYSSLAKLSLSEVYFAEGHADKGESLLRNLIQHPTIFVSKDQATIALARDIAQKKPTEARKLLDPLRNTPGEVGQVALQVYGDIPAQ
jgi:predicted negative regulator of RcsB-dependent stress response